MKPKLLIVDDEPDMLDYLERVFRTEFEVRRAPGGEEALAALAEAAAAGAPFLILVTDQKMPRMTGLELLERATAAHPALVKVLISGYSDVSEIQRAIERCGIHNHVVKPVDSEKLRDAIAQALTRARTGARYQGQDPGS